MKKVGIITHYYQSQNFGGNLQAYALATYLCQNGYSAEQISFQGNFDTPGGKRKRNLKFVVQLPFRAARSVVLRCRKAVEEKVHHVARRRKMAFSHFNLQTIPHSEKVYTSDTIFECAKEYDAFITGSDQVWNLKWYNPEYFLHFVPAEKQKIAYAASVTAESLTDEQKRIFEAHLRDFDAVSVRERGAVTMLAPLSPVPVAHALDPTLLLSREDWDGICSERLVKEEYLFCYFLGENKNERRLARAFAHKHHLKLVTIPHSGGWIKASDIGYGDIQCFDASPKDFLSLIKHANYVFTDSFHAVVFSQIYQKQYFVFNRRKDGEMSSRIRDVTALFDTEDHFCYDDTRANMKYIASVQEIDYGRENLVLENMLRTSSAFLKDSLNHNQVNKNAGEK